MTYAHQIKTEKMNSIMDNYVNGNYSDFRKQIKGLTRIQIVSLLMFGSSLRSEDEQMRFANKIVNCLGGQS